MGCGTWVSMFAATSVLRVEEMVPDRATRWWRVRAPCPECTEQMTLRGRDPGLFQGCDVHGFWIDADAIEHTGLVRGVDRQALARKRENEDALAAERKLLHSIEQARAQKKAQKQRTEAALDRKLGTPRPAAAAVTAPMRAPRPKPPAPTPAAPSPAVPDLGEEAKTLSYREAEIVRLARALRSGRFETIAETILALTDRIAVLEQRLGEQKR